MPNPPVKSASVPEENSGMIDALYRAVASEEHCSKDKWRGYRMPSSAYQDGIFSAAACLPAICVSATGISTPGYFGACRARLRTSSLQCSCIKRRV